MSKITVHTMTAELHYKLHSKLLPVICTVNNMDSSLSVETYHTHGHMTLLLFCPLCVSPSINCDTFKLNRSSYMKMTFMLAPMEFHILIKIHIWLDHVIYVLMLVWCTQTQTQTQNHLQKHIVQYLKYTNSHFWSGRLLLRQKTLSLS